ncbi:MAG TPA: cytochrome P450 [Ilumatobacteraceae bacterium]|nr:cytochrome P450 [Ilumatobacteraceae bacterium]
MTSAPHEPTAQRLLERDLYAGDPHPFFSWLRANQPVYCDPTGVWTLTRHDDIRTAERQPLLFSNAEGSRPNVAPQPSMIDCDDPLHAAQRRLVAQGFTNRQMQLYEGHVREVAGRLVDDVIEAGSCDIVEAFAKPLPMTLIGEMLGASPDDYERLQHWSDQMIGGSDDASYVTDEVVGAAFAYFTYITDVIADRRATPRDDLVSTLVHSAIGDESLDEDHIVGNSLLLLVGGNETTRSVITGGVHALLTHPEQLSIATASVHDGSVAPSVVEECLRWVTPINNMNRVTTQDVDVRGVTIPQGSQVLMSYLSANRDDDVFANPFEFDVTRNPNPHVSFGFGPHLCLGAQLARLELRVIFGEILTRLHDIRLADGDFVPTYSHSSFVRGIQELPITFTR